MAALSVMNFFFVSHFCFLEKILSIQIAQDPQKIKTMHQKFIKVTVYLQIGNFLQIWIFGSN